ncbi:MAG: hypothetical protein VX010_10420, partial [Pseudomonadota bacterium]|nr:hypothetical protein [Pseudomonadota bacterium]
GKQRAANSRDYIVLIYDLKAISNWLKKIAPNYGEYIFINQDNQVIASSKTALNTAISASEHWPNVAIDMSKNNHSHLVQEATNLPIYTRFYE